jgi:hypothetical protein
MDFMCSSHGQRDGDVINHFFKDGEKSLNETHKDRQLRAAKAAAVPPRGCKK